ILSRRAGDVERIGLGRRPCKSAKQKRPTRAAFDPKKVYEHLLGCFPGNLKFDLFGTVTSFMLDAHDGALRNANSFVRDLYDELFPFLKLVGKAPDLTDE